MNKKLGHDQRLKLINLAVNFRTACEELEEAQAQESMAEGELIRYVCDKHLPDEFVVGGDLYRVDDVELAVTITPITNLSDQGS